jgi:hypothetical protein
LGFLSQFWGLTNLGAHPLLSYFISLLHDMQGLGEGSGMSKGRNEYTGSLVHEGFQRKKNR